MQQLIDCHYIYSMLMHEQINSSQLSIHESALIHLESIVKWLKQQKAEMLMDGIELPIPEHKLREYRKIKKRKRIPESESILPQHAEVLFILLNAAGPLPLSAIKENMIEKSADVSRLVEKLELIGLVENRAHRGNRRKHDISLTEYGTEKAKLFQKNYFKYVQFIEQQLHLDEAEFLINIMKSVATINQKRTSLIGTNTAPVEANSDLPDWVVEEPTEEEKAKKESNQKAKADSGDKKKGKQQESPEQSEAPTGFLPGF